MATCTARFYNPTMKKLLFAMFLALLMVACGEQELASSLEGPESIATRQQLEPTTIARQQTERDKIHATTSKRIGKLDEALTKNDFPSIESQGSYEAGISDMSNLPFKKLKNLKGTSL